MGESANEIEVFKSEMKALFHMSDLGMLSYYLGIEVKQGRCSIELCQTAYAKKLQPVFDTNGDAPEAFQAEHFMTIDAMMYRSLIGSLWYLVYAWPDLAFAMGYLIRFMEELKHEHMTAMRRLLQYVPGTINYDLAHTRSDAELCLVGYSHSDMEGDVDDRKSTTGIIFFLGGNPVSWQSRKQRMVALSSCKAEYITGTAAACQGVWLGRLLGDVLGAKTTPP
ncbi:secreted RxLR effector protein 161-like [Phragmites australis]|uniref:secreted RxLR effector protein 161-like n=1 Tax=Phragmites australis TaxID=29695 RepID=UPI002D77AFC4|nr:secreted RxLR effector protein 161-like [Phragmites australis]